jgi:hypothetical protein
MLIGTDALCISQDDLKERADQVRLMSSIYSQAEYVYIWLGEVVWDVYEAPEVLIKIFERLYKFYDKD